jgi:hypothetical protein
MTGQTGNQPLHEQLSKLHEFQLSNGSWPYRKGATSGLAEPTCYALLALYAAGIRPARLGPALDWLESLRRSGNGFAPQEGVDFSNWSTSLVIQVFLRYGRQDAALRGVRWLLGLHGIETAAMVRTLRKVFNKPPQYPQNFHGWPWLPDTVSWLIPTSLAVLALQQAEAARPSSKQRDRIEQGVSMIKERRCEDGGWNHGAPAALGVPARSYPETTGIALLCLQQVPSTQLPGADALAASMLTETRIASTTSWLQLALQARGATVPDVPENEIACRNTTDYALRVLAQKALEGNNVFRAS